MCLFTFKSTIHLSLLSLRLGCWVGWPLFICHFLLTWAWSRCQHSWLLDVYSIVTRLLFRFDGHSSINFLNSDIFWYNFFNMLRELGWCCFTQAGVIISSQLVITWGLLMIIFVITGYRVDHDISNYVVLMFVKLLFDQFYKTFLFVARWRSTQRTQIDQLFLIDPDQWLKLAFLNSFNRSDYFKLATFLHTVFWDSLIDRSMVFLITLQNVGN